MKLLHLSLDELWEQGYIYSKFDVRGGGHDLYIEPENREKFLDDYAEKFRKQVEKLLREEEVDWHS